MANWTRETDHWFPIATLAPSYKGPVVFTNDTQTVIWFSENADRAQIDNSEHERDPGSNEFLFDDGQPRLKRSKVKPAFWALAKVTD